MPFKEREVLVFFIEVLLDKKIFFVFPSNKSGGFPMHELATYSCPCEKHGFSKFSPHT